VRKAGRGTTEVNTVAKHTQVYDKHFIRLTSINTVRPGSLKQINTNTGLETHTKKDNPSSFIGQHKKSIQIFKLNAACLWVAVMDIFGYV